MGSIVVFLLGSAALVGTTILRGYVLSVLWAWFVVTAFGVPALGIVSAIGISMVVTYLTYQHNATKAPQGFGAAMTTSLLSSLVTLLFGYIVHLYI